MNKIHWQNTKVSNCETHHVYDDKPLYPQRYQQVLKFHNPGLAPSQDHECAYHIQLDGQPAYPARFIETFGFYEGCAAVRDESGWYHITVEGKPCYKERYQWCGNFQEGLSVVKNQLGLYCHINKYGQVVYHEKYAYVGDFKDEVAVVCNSEGLHTHINPQGKLVHNKWFIDLDVFHKGFARAKDHNGWFHINKQGQQIYTDRFLSVEPFYNGISRVASFNEAILTIDTGGNIVKKIRQPRKLAWQELSSDLVGFWRTEIIATAARLNIFDDFPASTSQIASKNKISQQHLERLLRALWELKLIEKLGSAWVLSEKGQALIAGQNKFMAAAAVMWSDVNSLSWKKLFELIQIGNNNYHPVFKSKATDYELSVYHRAIDGYAKEDFSDLKNVLDWQSHKHVIGVGRCAKTIIEELLIANNKLTSTLIGENYQLQHIPIRQELISRYKLLEHDIHQPWPEKADAIFLPRVLHYWPDQEMLSILKNAKKSLLVSGKIYLCEMILSDENPGGSLLDLNMFVETGGKLRFLAEWEKIFLDVSLVLEKKINLKPWLTMFVLRAL